MALAQRSAIRWISDHDAVQSEVQTSGNINSLLPRTAKRANGPFPGAFSVKRDQPVSPEGNTLRHPEKSTTLFAAAREAVKDDRFRWLHARTATRGRTDCDEIGDGKKCRRTYVTLAAAHAAANREFGGCRQSYRTSAAAR